MKQRRFGRPHRQLLKDKPWGKAFPLFEAIDTFLFTPGATTRGPVHVRDGLDYKRMMTAVVLALMPCVLMAMYNTGYQANLAMLSLGLSSAGGWRGWLMDLLHVGYSPANVWFCLIHGALYFIPVYLVANVAGGVWEVLFAIVRKHEVQEGLFVTGFLVPLIMPPTVPLWQVAVAMTFAIVLGKEIFGGTGRNWLNPALTARVFLFFAYPAAISGDAVWTAVDGFTGATPLAMAAEGGMEQLTLHVSWSQAFLGQIPGSMGETSTLACLLGAALLLFTGIGSWRIMAGMMLGAAGFWALVHGVGSETNPMFAMPFHWHLVLGGFAFGLVFMATDPVTAAATRRGKWIYGILVGVMAIMIRVVNPAFPEGVMLAILFGNVFAPLIDYYVVKANKKRRVLRHAA
ncbi:MAG: NADH:ubiquinone reductase (Na(+)-transporting) subunit B [Candidatus Krumholzibacteriota bacterium]|nr:NADH:ubiquinone reductase (Na(+)-transporting) subunit B [Candidatus Krumholzibacteriota bacterium]